MKEKTDNIDILEELIRDYKDEKEFVGEEIIKAIETLIAENKELKEENKCLKNKELDYMTVYLTGTYDERDKWKSKLEELKKYEEGYKLLSYSLDNYISKDKIKAKIEELDYNDIGNFERRCKQEILQSLLEKE